MKKDRWENCEEYLAIFEKAVKANPQGAAKVISMASPILAGLNRELVPFSLAMELIELNDLAQEVVEPFKDELSKLADKDRNKIKERELATLLDSFRSLRTSLTTRETQKLEDEETIQ